MQVFSSTYFTRKFISVEFIKCLGCLGFYIIVVTIENRILLSLKTRKLAVQGNLLRKTTQRCFSKINQIFQSVTPNLKHLW